MAENPKKQVLLNRIYIKDCSYEAPRTPEVFDLSKIPEVKVNMHVANRSFDNGTVEVVLTVTAEARADEQTVFLVEVHQAGLFTVGGFSPDEFQAILASYCPSILFPYAREAVSEMVLKGNMPALLLQPVNFDAMLAQTLANKATAN